MIHTASFLLTLYLCIFTQKNSYRIMQFALVQLYFHNISKLEQIECLHYEIPATTPWLPLLVIHIRFQVKKRQSQSYKFIRLPKIQILKFCKEINMLHTFWRCLIRCIIWNGSNRNCRCYRAETGCRTEGRTDRRTDWKQYIYYYILQDYIYT